MRPIRWIAAVALLLPISVGIAIFPKTLHQAVASNNAIAVRILLFLDQDVNHPDPSGKTPIFFADSRSMAALLIAAGAQPNVQAFSGATPLHQAAREGNLEVVEFLIEAGVEIDARFWHGWTPLHFAAWGDHEAIARSLLAAGAPINVRDGYGLTPLGVARNQNHLQLAQLLQEQGGIE